MWLTRLTSPLRGHHQRFQLLPPAHRSAGDEPEHVGLLGREARDGELAAVGAHLHRGPALRVPAVHAVGDLVACGRHIRKRQTEARGCKTGVKFFRLLRGTRAATNERGVRSRETHVKPHRHTEPPHLLEKQPIHTAAAEIKKIKNKKKTPPHITFHTAAFHWPHYINIQVALWPPSRDPGFSVSCAVNHVITLTPSNTHAHSPAANPQPGFPHTPASHGGSRSEECVV